MKFFLLALLISLVVISLLVLVDRKIKSGRNILSKIGSVFFIGLFLFGFLCLNGQAILELFHVDAKSFTSLKAFCSSRIIVILSVLLIYLFVFFKTVFFVNNFMCEVKPEEHQEMTKRRIASIVFDIAVIPNILFLGTQNIALMVAGIILSVELGLALIKLVFSIFIKENKEVMYA